MILSVVDLPQPIICKDVTIKVRVIPGGALLIIRDYRERLIWERYISNDIDVVLRIKDEPEK